VTLNKNIVVLLDYRPTCKCMALHYAHRVH